MATQKQTKKGKKMDAQRKAKHPGECISKSGKKYTENRPNHSDKNRTKKI